MMNPPGVHVDADVYTLEQLAHLAHRFPYSQSSEWPGLQAYSYTGGANGGDGSAIAGEAGSDDVGSRFPVSSPVDISSRLSQPQKSLYCPYTRPAHCTSPTLHHSTSTAPPHRSPRLVSPPPHHHVDLSAQSPDSRLTPRVPDAAVDPDAPGSRARAVLPAPEHDVQDGHAGGVGADDPIMDELALEDHQGGGGGDGCGY